MYSPKSGKHTPLLLISYAITFLALVHVVAGAGIAGNIAYAWTRFHYQNSSSVYWWYAFSDAVTIRGVLVAFWCTTPGVLFLASGGVLFSLKRRGSLPLWLTVPYAVVSFAAWATQMGLEGDCIWGQARYQSESTAFCPWIFGSNSSLQGVDNWASGILAAWVMPWFIIPFFPLYAGFIFYSLKSAGGKQPQRQITSQEHDHVSLMPRIEPASARQTSQKYSRASSRFTDVAMSSIDGDATLGPPSYESARFGSLKSVDEKSVWSIDEEKAGKF